MKKYYKGKQFSQIYKNILNDIIKKPEFISNPRDFEIKEITNLQFELENPLCSMYKNSRRSSQFKYIAAELIWYFSASNDLSFIEKYSKFWRNIANKDNTLNSAYGNLLFNKHYDVIQWKWAYDALLLDKDSRQAIMHFNMPSHQTENNKDFVCTMYGIFQIRNNKLNFTINMRSNDIVLGLPTDLAFFCLLQQQMLKLLKENKYPDLKLGTYTHIANSMHLYKRNYKLAQEMLECDFLDVEFSIGKENLINETGKCSNSITLLNNAVRYNKFELLNNNEDPLIKWVLKNI